MISFPQGTEMFHFPWLPAYDYEFIVSSSRFQTGGFPIRKSPDQSSLAAPRGLSQPATSFIDAYRLGIHRVLFITSNQTSRFGPKADHKSCDLQTSRDRVAYAIGSNNENLEYTNLNSTRLHLLLILSSVFKDLRDVRRKFTHFQTMHPL